MSERHVDTDIAIIGGGGAGIAAALEAKAAGARAVLLEQDDALGGTAATSGGGCFLVGTPLQESLGIVDTPDLAFADWVAWGRGAVDEVWARYYIEHTLHDLYHWAEKHGAKWMDLKFQEGNRVHRWHRPDGNGFGLMQALVSSMTAHAAADVFTGTRADGLLTDRGRVSGVRAIDTRTGDVTDDPKQDRRGRDRRLQLQSRDGAGGQARAERVPGHGGLGTRRQRIGPQAHRRARRLPHPHGRDLVLRVRDARLPRPHGPARPRLSRHARLYLGQPAGPALSRRVADGRRIGLARAHAPGSRPRLGHPRYAHDGGDGRRRSVLPGRRPDPARQGAGAARPFPVHQEGERARCAGARDRRRRADLPR